MFCNVVSAPTPVVESGLSESILTGGWGDNRDESRVNESADAGSIAFDFVAEESADSVSFVAVVSSSMGFSTVLDSPLANESKNMESLRMNVESGCGGVLAVGVIMAVSAMVSESAAETMPVVFTGSVSLELMLEASEAESIAGMVAARESAAGGMARCVMAVCSVVVSLAVS